MSTPAQACIALGANLGDPCATVGEAIQRIARLPGVSDPRASSLYRSAPHEASGPDFINAVMVVRTSLAPLELLDALQAIELEFGRERPYRNAPRTLDLDLLLHGATRMTTPRLTLPHPRMHERAFVLVPLAQVMPQAVPPAQLAAVSGQAITRLVNTP